MSYNYDESVHHYLVRISADIKPSRDSSDRDERRAIRQADMAQLHQAFQRYSDVSPIFDELEGDILDDDPLPRLVVWGKMFCFGPRSPESSYKSLFRNMPGRDVRMAYIELNHRVPFTKVLDELFVYQQYEEQSE